MDGEFLSLIKNASVEIIVMAACVWFLTMFIKIPIKKATEKLEESKRKMVNTLILIIPMVLSLACCIGFFGLPNGVWFSMAILESAISVCVLSYSIYAVTSRIWKIVRGLLNGSHINPELAKEVVAEIKDDLKVLGIALKIDEASLKKVEKSLDKILQVKSTIEANFDAYDNETVAKTDSEIKQLKKEEETLLNKIILIKQKIQTCEQELYVDKGE